MKNFEDLKRDYCIAVPNVGFKNHEGLQPDVIVGEPNTYNVNNGVVSFIDEKGTPYITPFSQITTLLDKLNYKQAGLHVPYSQGIPEAYQAKWHMLVTASNSNNLDEIEVESSKKM